MTAVDWDEVKRLAADFQRAQLTSSSQTLSERNCVEIINKLIETNVLDVIFTIDGKEYITPQYLVKEIKDELYVHGGRVNLVELSKSLNVDLSHVSARIPEVEKSSGCSVIMGQLINKTYQKTIAEEINDRLQRDGQFTIAEFTKVYDLPGDFLQSVVEKNLGKIIKGKQDKSDPRVFYTQNYLEKNKAILRGVLRALTRPTQVFVILETSGLEERDFYFAFDCLAEEKLTCGSLTARQVNASFVPHVYTKQQNDWIQNFYKQNGYLDLDAINELGISDSVAFVKRNFPDLLRLSRCAVGPQLLDQIEAAVEEALVSATYIDLMTVVPSVLNPDDVRQALDQVLKRNNFASYVGGSAPHIFSDSVLVSEAFIQGLIKLFTDKGIVDKKAQQAISDGSYIQLQVEKKLGKPLTKEKDDGGDGKFDKKEERRRKAAGGKSGGGAQGRETKTKGASKKKGRPRKESGSESDGAGGRKFEPFSLEEVEQELDGSRSLEELQEVGVLSDLADHLLPLLNKVTLEAAARRFEEALACGAGDRRKAYQELEAKLESWLIELRLSERAVRLFTNDSTQGRLVANLLKTIGTDLTNSLFVYATSSEGCAAVDPKKVTAEMRIKMLTEVDGEARDWLTALHKALSGSNLEEFLTAADKVLSVVGILGRKIDKKKEKQFAQRRRETLLSQLSSETTPAVALQVGVLSLFQAATGQVLQVSGKFVPTVLAFLQSHLTNEDFSELQVYQDLILTLLTVDNEERESQIKSELNEKLPRIKEIIINYRKSSSKDS